jgi:DHA2 family multidrug resistance protein-like MFS transporter
LPAAAHAATGSLGAALQSAAALPGPAGTTLGDVARQAYVHAFDQTLIVAVGVALLASGLVLWLLRPEPRLADDTQSVLEAEAA